MALWIVVAPSEIEHPIAGRDVFAARAFGEGDIVGEYYGALIYGKGNATPRTNEHVGEGHFRAFADTFRKFAVRLKGKVTDTFRDRDP